MNLSELKAKKRGKILKILDRKEVEIKLISIGICVDEEIMMIKNDFSGAVIVAIGDNRIVLGRDLSDKIQIEAL
ncbi:MAG: FeoA family protein [Parachlamydiales bacterium]|jgi:Fe2+ transport system protein FeoA